MATKTNQYEAMFLLSASYASDVDGAVKMCRGVVEKHQGEVLVAKKWDERKLSYEIGKAKRGLYVIVYFKAPSSAVSGLERDVKLSEEFIRVLVTKADHLSVAEMEAVEPQPIAPPQPERQPWDDVPPMGGIPSAVPAAPRAPRKKREEAGAAAEAAAGKE